MSGVLRGAGHILTIMTDEEPDPIVFDPSWPDLSDPKALPAWAREFVEQIRRAIKLD